MLAATPDPRQTCNSSHPSQKSLGRKETRLTQLGQIYEWAVGEDRNVQPATCTLELCPKTSGLLFLLSSSHLFNSIPLLKLNLLAWGYWAEALAE